MSSKNHTITHSQSPSANTSTIPSPIKQKVKVGGQSKKSNNDNNNNNTNNNNNNPVPDRSTFSYQDRLQLKTIIESLSKTDWESICRHILIPNEENITVNQNGVLFDLNTLSDDSISQINKHIRHIKQIAKNLVL